MQLGSAEAASMLCSICSGPCAGLLQPWRRCTTCYSFSRKLRFAVSTAGHPAGRQRLSCSQACRRCSALGCLRAACVQCASVGTRSKHEQTAVLPEPAAIVGAGARGPDS